MPGKKLLADVTRYYADRLAKHGDTPAGVDWNGEESQAARFEILCKVINSESPSFSVNDLGCGYAAFLDYLLARGFVGRYFGIDVCPEMIRSAQQRHIASSQAYFVTASEPDRVADYGVASGIFNVRLGRTDDEWFEYLQTTLDALNRTSRLGFAFNCLTSYSDEDRMRDYLYYADPCRLFDLCKRRYSRHVALLHDYGLYEFTILVRK